MISLDRRPLDEKRRYHFFIYRNFCLAQTVPDEYGVGNEDGFTVGDIGYDVDLRSEMDAELEKEEQARANISRILNELIDGYDRNLRPNIRGKSLW